MTTKTRIDRREFLKVGALGGVAAAAAGCASVSTTGVTRASGSRARSRETRNVIFMVSDGMSTGTLTLADMAIRERTGRGSAWTRLWGIEGARRAMCRTHAADSLVTDSAAAGSAWGIGEHINNGAVNFTPDERTPTPILVQARENGLGTGLVTTTRVTHATPASFVANIPSRDLEGGIAEQILDRGVDVVLGGGARYFPDGLLAQHPDVKVVRTGGELDRAEDDGGRLLGLFKREHMSFELDRGEDEPHIRTMARAALDRLSSRGDGFVLQIEGGRVDHAAHANDACAIIADQIAFDEALEEAVRFTMERDDTLLIVTTDHGNANPGLTLYKEPGNQGFARLERARHSFDWISDQMGTGASPEEMMGVLPMLVYQATGVELRDSDRAWLYRHFVEHERADGFLAASGFGPVLGAVLANSLGVAFVSPNHTADLVEVTALGPGAERLAPTIDNIDLHELMVGTLALRPAGA
ncbi:MAG: alkaline phosphatase [Phycisphaerales bacterium]